MIAIVLVGTAALYFYNALRIRELAISAARKRCAEIGVQFLDQSVSANGTKLLTRQGSAPARWLLERCYCFEFTSTGEERYTGRIAMHGYRVASIELAPHRIPESDARE